MAKLSKDELDKIKAELKAQADLQQRLNENTGDYLKLIKEIKELNKSITQTKAKQLEQELKTKDAVTAYLAEKFKGAAADKVLLKELRKQKEIEKAKSAILKDELHTLERMTKEMVKQAKEASKISAAFSTLKKDVSVVNKVISVGYGKLKNWAGLFDLDKSMRTSALQMGVLSKQTDSFRSSIQDAANQTADLGVSLDMISKLQAGYSEELGRNVMLGKQGLVAMAEMAAATGLGADGTSKMAADMEEQGYSALRTRDYIEQTMNDSHKMGLNASKVIKNIASNMKMLNKYQFKGGVKGLAKMAETVTKLGVDMEVVGSMADKLFDVEGAVEMSAQMQVMGGAWSKLADPMKLMYMARNDMEGLTQAMADAAKESMHFAKDGSIEMSAMEMQRLKKVAEATGVDFEKLVTMGKTSLKLDKARSQIKWNMSDDEKAFIAATATFNEKGEGSIMIGAEPKLISQLTSSDRGLLKAQILEQESLKKRAADSQTFDDKLTNLTNQFKQLLLPIVEIMDKELGPIVKELSDTLKDPKVVSGIRDAAKLIGKAIGVVGKFIANNPITSLIAVGLFEAGKWILNGMALGTGFNLVTGKGGLISAIMGLGSKLLKGVGKVAGGAMKMGGAAMKGAGKVGGKVMGAAGKVGGKAMEKFGMKEGIKVGGKALGKSILKKIPIISILAGIGFGIDRAIDGDWAGAGGELLSGVLGTIPGAGTAASIAVDAGLAARDISKADEPIEDGHFEGGRTRGVIQGGKITPIDNKDDLLAFKPKGPVDKALGGGGVGSTMKIEFGEIHFRFDELKVTSPGSPGIAIDLLKDPNFVRNVTRMVHVETEKVINGGKSKG